MGGTNDDLRFILSEYQQTPDSSGIDLFFGGEIDPFVELKQRGLLGAFHPPSALMDGIPTEISGLPLYDPQGCWFGTALSSFGILKNERVAQQMKLPPVRSWRDLTHPAMKGWIGSGDPRNSGATHMGRLRKLTLNSMKTKPDPISSWRMGKSWCWITLKTDPQKPRYETF